MSRERMLNEVKLTGYHLREAVDPLETLSWAKVLSGPIDVLCDGNQ